MEYLTSIFQIHYDDDHANIEYWLNDNAKKGWLLRSVTAFESSPPSVLIIMERDDEDALDPIGALPIRNNLPDVGLPGFEPESYLDPRDNIIWQDVLDADAGATGAADTNE